MKDIIPIIYLCCGEQHVAYLHSGAEAHGMQIDLLEVFEPGGTLYRVFVIRDATTREGDFFAQIQGLFTFLPDGTRKWAIYTEEGHPFYDDLDKARAGIERMRSHPERFNDFMPDSIFLEKLGNHLGKSGDGSGR
jgi:hypothetical protein